MTVLRPVLSAFASTFLIAACFGQAPKFTITTVAGTGVHGFAGDGGAATGALLNTPTAVIVDAAGNIYIADTSNHRIRKVGTDGNISTFAGTGNAASSGDGGPATSAALNTPEGLAIDKAGNMYIA